VDYKIFCRLEFKKGRDFGQLVKTWLEKSCYAGLPAFQDNTVPQGEKSSRYN
jgi:hypothetical protein